MGKQRQETDRSHLVKKFAEAGVALEIAKEPIRRGLRAEEADIFQLDIPRAFKGNSRRERFRIWPGHADNVIAVQGIDRELQQLVLMVHEPERTFTTTEYVRQLPPEIKVGTRHRGAKVVQITPARRDGYDVTTEHKTPNVKRHYLCGVDERQLFIAQLPRGVSNVRDAHAILKRPEVTFAEGKAPGRTVRQGEWFFVNLTASEEQALAAVVKKAPYLIHKNEPIGSGGHPHTADEIMRMPGEPLKHGFAVRANEVYVRGKVKHEEHATVSFARWRKVIRNNEAGQGDSSTRPSGVFWID